MSDHPPSPSGSRLETTHEKDVIIIRIPQDARLSPSMMQFLAGLTTSQSDRYHNGAWPSMSPPTTSSPSMSPPTVGPLSMSPSDGGQSSRWQSNWLPGSVSATSAVRRDGLRSAPSTPRGEGQLQANAAYAPAPEAHTTARPRARGSPRGICKAINYLRVASGEPHPDDSDTSSNLSELYHCSRLNFPVPQPAAQSSRQVAEDQILHSAGRLESPRAFTPSSSLDEDFAELLRLERLPTPPARPRAFSIRLPSRCPGRGRHRCASSTE